jgi:hypothetical protein
MAQWIDEACSDWLDGNTGDFEGETDSGVLFHLIVQEALDAGMLPGGG